MRKGKRITITAEACEAARRRFLERGGLVQRMPDQKVAPHRAVAGPTEVVVAPTELIGYTERLGKREVLSTLHDLEATA